MKKWLWGVAGFAVFLVVCLFLYRTLAAEYRPGNQLVTQAGQTGESGTETLEGSGEGTMGVAEESGVPESVGTENAAETEAASGAEASQEETLSDSLAPDFRFSDAAEKEFTLYQVLEQGKPVVINFWASWCGPCKSEMPEFQKLYEEKGEDIQFLMINLTDGSRETMETAQDFLAESGYTFPVYYDLWQEAAYKYYVMSIPMTLFLHADGTLAAYAQGAMDEETLRQGIGMLEE